VGKMFAAVVYALLAGAYLRWFEVRGAVSMAPRVMDVFDVLTYRQRYEALLERTGRDALTGLFDRGRFDEDGPRRLADARTGRQVGSILILDVDHFKEINDRHGHTAGDEVLRLIARVLSDRLRESDAVYRYGGEEFVVLCRGLAHRSALVTAERLRRDV